MVLTVVWKVVTRRVETALLFEAPNPRQALWSGAEGHRPHLRAGHRSLLGPEHHTPRFRGKKRTVPNTSPCFVHKKFFDSFPPLLPPEQCFLPSIVPFRVSPSVEHGQDHADEESET